MVYMVEVHTPTDGLFDVIRADGYSSADTAKRAVARMLNAQGHISHGHDITGYWLRARRV